jgi:hypothetical protein
MIIFKNVLRYRKIAFKCQNMFALNKMIFKDIAQSSYFKPILKVSDFLN